MGGMRYNMALKALEQMFLVKMYSCLEIAVHEPLIVQEHEALANILTNGPGYRHGLGIFPHEL